MAHWPIPVDKATLAIIIYLVTATNLHLFGAWKALERELEIELVLEATEESEGGLKARFPGRQELS
jgi:hypothetical protein